MELGILVLILIGVLILIKLNNQEIADKQDRFQVFSQKDIWIQESEIDYPETPMDTEKNKRRLQFMRDANKDVYNGRKSLKEAQLDYIDFMKKVYDYDYSALKKDIQNS
jgi:hypothetical protein